jgi:hypothetical protein
LDACSQRLLLERFANLLAHNLLYGAGLDCSKKAACAGQGVKREI